MLKNIRNFLSQRIFFVLFAVLIQAVLFVTVFFLFKDMWSYIYSIGIFLSVICVLILINDDENPAYKIAWLIPILLFPVFGWIIYFLLGRSALSSKDIKKAKQIYQKASESLIVEPFLFEELEQKDSTWAKQANYINSQGIYPLFKNNYVKYFPLGEKKWESMLEELKAAKKFIFLEYFIIQPGKMWDAIEEILVEKAQQGVDVRVMYDDVGSLTTVPKGFAKSLEAKGIKCSVFNPVRIVFSAKPHHRDHRKILSIDGETGYIGGINLADEYINAHEKHGHWKDTAILIKGSGVNNLTVMFLTMWDYLRQEENYQLYISSKYKNVEDFPVEMHSSLKGYIQPYSYNPLLHESTAANVYLNMIYKAQKYLYITTPYLILDNETVLALSTAAKAGVQVKIITPFVGDKWFVHALTRSFYSALIKSGVQIYEYTPGFIHAKSFLVDDISGIVGTINLDYRSLYLHFECGVWMYDVPCLADLKRDFIETIAKSQKITLESLQAMPMHKKIVASVLRVFAPLM